MRANICAPLIVLLTVSWVTGCVSSGPRKRRSRAQARTSAPAKPKPRLQEKGERWDSEQSTGSDHRPALGEASGSDWTNRMVQFVQRHQSADVPLSAEDLSFVGTLPNTAGAESLTSAVLAMAAIKRATTTNLSNSSEFEETDLYPSEEDDQPNNESPQNMGPPNLSQVCTQMRINLPEVLMTNSFVKTHAFFAQIAAYLAAGREKDVVFMSRVRAALAQEKAFWAELNPNQQADSIADLDQDNAVSHNQLDTLSPADLRNTDSVLMQAQELASSKQYREAIATAGKIPSRNPMYREAQEQIRVYSNSAVQELRQRAAQAFQSSIPVSDTSAKIAYLEEARTLLEQALQEYPQADQLETVRENLAIISQDLQTLDDSPEAEGSGPSTATNPGQ